MVQIEKLVSLFRKYAEYIYLRRSEVAGEAYVEVAIPGAGTTHWKVMFDGESGLVTWEDTGIPVGFTEVRDLLAKADPDRCLNRLWSAVYHS